MNAENRKNKITPQRICDVVFFVVAAMILGLFVYSARLGVPSADESFFYTVSQRILRGDRMIVDEWNLGQFGNLLNVPAVWVYTKLAGGTEGLILFMRYVFIALHGGFCIYLYAKLRFLGPSGVVSSLLYLSVIPQSIFALYYFTSFSMAVTAVCVSVVLRKKEKSAVGLICGGAVLAVGVMTEPLLIVCFLLWALAVILRECLKKKNSFFEAYAFFLNKRTFLWMSAGAFAVFSAFMLFLYATGSLAGIPKVLPYLFTGSEYNAGNIIDEHKIYGMFEYYGPVLLLLFFLCIGASAVLYIKKKDSKKIRLPLFVLICALLVGCYIHAETIDGYAGVTAKLNNHAVLLLYAGVGWFLLNRRGDGSLRARLAVLLSAGVCCGIAVDISSTAVLGSGAMLGQIAGVYGFFGLLGELADEFKTQREKHGKPLKGLCAAALALSVVCGAAAVLWHADFLVLETLRKPIESTFSAMPHPAPERLTAGPYKGLITTKGIAAVYYDTLADCDRIMEKANGERVAVLSLEPFAYLYMDLPVGVFSTWLENEPARVADYWRVLPENRPAYIYLPFYNNMYFFPNKLMNGDYPKNITDMLSELCSFTEKNGKAGRLIEVKEWYR